MFTTNSWESSEAPDPQSPRVTPSAVPPIDPVYAEQAESAVHQTLLLLQQHAQQVQRAAALARIYLAKPAPPLSEFSAYSETEDEEVSSESAEGNPAVIGFYYLARAHEHALKMLEAGDQITAPTSRWATQGKGAKQAAAVTRDRLHERMADYNAGREKFEEHVKEWEELQNLWKR